MDGDTDDAMALLTGVLENIPGADAGRVAATGSSRGAGVSHLMSVKDRRIKRTAVRFGATDHLALPGLQEVVENYYDNSGGTNPPERTSVTYGADPYLDETLTLAEARLSLLRRSAVYFVEDLPLPYQVHHGDADNVVWVSHSRLLAAAFADLGIGDPDFTYYEYPGGGHGNNMSGSTDLVRTLLCELRDAPIGVEGCMDTTGTNYDPDATIACSDCCEYTGTEGGPSFTGENVIKISHKTLSVRYDGKMVITVNNVKGEKVLSEKRMGF